MKNDNDDDDDDDALKSPHAKIFDRELRNSLRMH